MTEAVWLGTTYDLEQWVTVVISYNGEDKVVSMLDGKIGEYEWTGWVDIALTDPRVDMTGEYLQGEYYNFTFYD